VVAEGVVDQALVMKRSARGTQYRPRKGSCYYFVNPVDVKGKRVSAPKKKTAKKESTGQTKGMDMGMGMSMSI
jgi:hypothetical protein